MKIQIGYNSVFYSGKPVNVWYWRRRDWHEYTMCFLLGHRQREEVKRGDQRKFCTSHYHAIQNNMLFV